MLFRSLFLSWFKNDQNSYYLLVNTGGSGSFLNYYNIIVGFIRGITIINLKLIFCILAFSNSV